MFPSSFSVPVQSETVTVFATKAEVHPKELVPIALNTFVPADVAEYVIGLDVEFICPDQT